MGLNIEMFLFGWLGLEPRPPDHEPDELPVTQSPEISLFTVTFFFFSNEIEQAENKYKTK